MCPRGNAALCRRLAPLLVSLAVALAAPAARAATFYVDAGSGDDLRTAAAAQDPGTPWQSVSRALGEGTLAPGDHIEVAAGLYDAALEAFPLALVDGVELVGAGTGLTTLSAPAGVTLFQNLDTPLSATTRLSGFTLTWDGFFLGPAAAIELEVSSVAMAPTIEGNRIVGAGGFAAIGILTSDDGAGARAFTPSIQGNELEGLGAGIGGEWSRGGADALFAPVIDGNDFSDLDVGVELRFTDQFEGTAAPEVTGGNSFTDVGEGVIVEGSGLEGGGATIVPVISDNQFEDVSSAIMVDLVGVFLPVPDRVVLSPTVTGNGIGSPVEIGIWIIAEDLDSLDLEMHPVVVGNSVDTPSAGGVRVQVEDLEDVEELDFDLTVAHNRVIGSSEPGIAVTLDSDLTDIETGVLHAALVGNRVAGGVSDGILVELEELLDSDLDIDVVIEGNHVSDKSGAGLSLFFDLEDTGGPARVRVDDNVLDGMSGRGIDLEHLGILSDGPGDPYVSGTCNRVSGNGFGGVLDLGHDVATDWGGDGLSAGLNSIVGNTGSAFENSGSSGQILAEQNWWGSTDSGAIDAAITGDVDFEPFLAGPPLVAVESSLAVVLASDDALPAGPSAGDTFAYTTVARGTGECGCTTAILTIPIPTGATLDTGSVLVTDDGTLLATSPGAIVVGLGALGPADLVTVSFDVVGGPGSQNTTQGELSCQADAASALTEPPDDPDTVDDDDPTTVEYAVEGPEEPINPLDVPALGSWQLLLLALLVSGAAVLVLGRRG